MNWNYRIVRRRDGSYGLHEVYYDHDGNAEYMTAKEVRASEMHRTEAEALPIFIEPEGWVQ